MRRRLCSLALLLGTAAAHAQPMRDFDMFLGSTAPGGGHLVMAHDFCRAVLVTPGLRAGGVTRYTSTQPGFNEVTSDRPGAVHVLRDATPVSVRISDIGPGVSVKLGSALLTVVGESALIGTAPNLHVHPEWRLELPDGAGGESHVEFVLTTGSPRYADSPPYRFTLTTDPEAADLCNDGGGGAPGPEPATVDHLLPGRLLMLKAAPVNPARKSMRLELAGAFDAAAGIDPTISGGRLRVLTNAGDRFEGRYDLPAGRWKATRKRGRVVGYRFRDPRGPVRRIELSFTKGATVIGSGARLSQSIARSPAPVDVWLAIGGVRACVRFGGTVVFKAGKLFKATAAPPPDLCAP